MIVPMVAVAVLSIASIYFAGLLEHAGPVAATTELFAMLGAVLEAGALTAAAILIIMVLLA